MKASSALTASRRFPHALHGAVPEKSTSLAIRTQCSTCHLRELCLPCGLKGRDVGHMDELNFERKLVKRGHSLYRIADPFRSLYAVRKGSFKSDLLLENGRGQIAGFHMPGEIVGMDGISSGTHASSAIALEDSEVCALPYTQLENLSRDLPSLQLHIHRMMSREIVRDQGVMQLLGSMCAEQRLAAFLLNLAQRFKARGYSSSEFSLPMSREDIGSYLGLKIETVSRMFSKFHALGLIDVEHKRIHILDVAGLSDTMRGN